MIDDLLGDLKNCAKFCRTLPDTWEARRIGAQLIDSATSVAMNYRAAGCGRSRAEFIAKLGIVVEEADESVGWLELIARLEISKGAELVWLLGESQELLAIFVKSQKTAKREPPTRPFSGPLGKWIAETAIAARQTLGLARCLR